jgi:hypothetical protein
MTYAESIAEKLPVEEREELIKFMGDAFRSLSPEEKGIVIDLNLANIRAKIREYGGLVTENQAREKIIMK